ncbi:hypothetical protein N7466_006793 [Penicillium verhagenii]|uniref:uncharacterized protein n=1 Tax=Penicillium verhagenii TaxID=1562060 RepID=UPI00254527BC|nr:uncharacterized protein N7466_006793 [Penicillium verhagenii]KAJ5927837.1 hypothetical protein N7466_006793 [Penicillium verhagenii]
MVGVAGKSKGCNTCRKRKIACDQEKPTCKRCTQSNRVCGGYEKERVFVLVQPAAEKTHTYLRSPPEPQRNAKSPVEEARRVQATVPFTKRNSAYKLIQNHIECHSLIQAFLSNCFPSQWVSAAPRSWIALLGELPTKAETLEISTAAVAASALGNMFHMPDLVKTSHKYYTQGLRQLQKALYDPVLMHDDGTLAACMALSLYEALECPSAGSEGYFSHCHGLIALIQARGVHAHTSGAGHQLFLGLRVPGILYALQRNDSTVLFDSKWMEQPWAEYTKSPFDRVTDCFAHAPGILERVRKIPSLGVDDQLNLAYSLIHECWQVDNSLDIIYDEMQHSDSGSLYWPRPSQQPIFAGMDGSLDLFPMVFCFSNIETAKTLILLWATRTMLWVGLCNLYKLVEFLTGIRGYVTITDEARLPPLSHREDYISMAYHVCQSVEYFLQDKMLLAGPMSVSPALGIVLDSLQQGFHPHEVTWLRAALDVVRRKGLRALEYVTY